MTEPHSTAFSFHGKKGNNLIKFDFNIAALNSGLDTWSLLIGIALALKNVPVLVAASMSGVAASCLALTTPCKALTTPPSASRMACNKSGRLF